MSDSGLEDRADMGATIERLVSRLAVSVIDFELAFDFKDCVSGLESSLDIISIGDVGVDPCVFAE